MTTPPARRAVDTLCGAARDGLDALADAELLTRFLERRDGTAFARIVRRHGPMVWGVCRRVAGNDHDAEDAFQATFLVLLRKAASVRPRDRLACWLHGVARNVARKAASHSRRERTVAELPERAAEDFPTDGDWAAILDLELNRLPGLYRAAILLCDIRGEKRRDAARQLGVPEGTLSARLTRGRRMLAEHLRRHGVTLPAGLLSAASLDDLISAPIDAAVRGSASARAAALAEGVIKAMFLKNVMAMAAGAAVMGVMLLAGTLTNGSAQERDEPADPAETPADLTAKSVPRAWREPAVLRDHREGTVGDAGNPLEGHWECVESAAIGLKSLREMSAGKRWVITSDAIIILNKDGTQKAMTYALPDGPGRPAIDLQPAGEDHRFLGVYERRDDWLIIRFTTDAAPGATRPASVDWATHADNQGTRRVVLRRVPARAVQLGDGEWSERVNGLRGRLVLRPQIRNNGTGIIRLVLELRNTSSETIRVMNDPADVRFEVLDAKGNPVAESHLPRSGPQRDAEFCVIPPEAYLGFALHSTGVGIPRDRGALLPLRTQDWVLDPGRYTLKGTFSVTKSKIRPEGGWLGVIDLPPVTIEVE